MDKSKVISDWFKDKWGTRYVVYPTKLGNPRFCSKLFSGKSVYIELKMIYIMGENVWEANITAYPYDHSKARPFRVMQLKPTTEAEIDAKLTHFYKHFDDNLNSILKELENVDVCYYRDCLIKEEENIINEY